MDSQAIHGRRLLLVVAAHATLGDQQTRWVPRDRSSQDHDGGAAFKECPRSAKQTEIPMEFHPADHLEEH